MKQLSGILRAIRLPAIFISAAIALMACDWVMPTEVQLKGTPDYQLPAGVSTIDVRDHIDLDKDLLTELRASFGEEAVTGEVENFLNFDWPVAADLSYSNSEFLNTNGLGGFAIGDLNWFPDQKADWEAQREEEYALLGEALNSGEFPTSFDTPSANVPTTIELKQNYPNPFNPSTQIEYTLAEPANITIEVYDTAGQRVATLVNDSFQQSGTHNVRFDASSLSSGVYFYRLSAGSQQLTGKMTLIK